MTLNNYSETEYQQIQEYVKSHCKFWIIGKEMCPSTNTPHLQAYFSLKEKKRLTTLKSELSDRAHFEAAKGTKEQNAKYCSKEGNYITNMKIPKPLKIISVLKPWQQDVIDIIKTEPNDRDVYWFWEETGCTGKSALCKYIMHHYNGIYIDEGKKSDIMNIIYNTDMDDERPVIFDIPRDNFNHVSYKSIESIKDGKVCNTKYETGYKLFNSPHVIVFCNYPPDRERLSSDRWKIKEII